MHPDVKRALDDKKITAMEASMLVSLSWPDQLTVLRELLWKVEAKA